MAVAAVLALANATPAVADDLPGLTIVGGTDADRSIDLAPCRQSARAPARAIPAIARGLCPKTARGEDYLTGVLVLSLVSDAKTKGEVRLRYVPKDGKRGFRVPGRSQYVVLARDDGAARRLPIAPSRLHTLRLRFALAPEAPPSTLDGQLALELLTKNESAGMVPLPISAKMAELGKIVLQPPQLEMSVTSRGKGGTAEVDLVGPGVRDLLARPSGDSPAVRMRNDDDYVIATLDLPDAVMEDDPERARATVSLSDDLDPGEYAGDLPVWELAPDALTLPLVVKVHWGMWVALLAVFVGVVFGVFLRQLFLMSQRRELMESTLNESLKAYDKGHAHLERARPDGIPVWDLEDMLQPRPEGYKCDSGKVERLKGIQGIMTGIRHARSTVDLDEDTVRVLDVVARLQRWLRVAPAAWRLKQVLETEPRKRGIGVGKNYLRWDRTRAYLDAALLLEAALQEPPSSEKVDDLVERLLHQAEWSSEFRNAWAVADSNADVAEVVALNAFAEAKHSLERDATYRDQLDVRLHGVARNLAVEYPTAGLPLPQAEGLSHVHWTASPNTFTGWATLDGKSYGQLVDQAQATIRSYSIRRVLGDLRRIGWLDVLSSLVAILIACAIYLPTVYNNTWGGVPDLLTALFAGLTANVLIDWAALPAFQSRRLRAQQA
jgi:hypothetical protein